MKLNYVLMCLISVSCYTLANCYNKSRRTRRQKSPPNGNRFRRNWNTFRDPPAIISIEDKTVPFDLSHTKPQDIIGPRRHTIALTCYKLESNSCRKTIKTTGKLCYLNHRQCRKHMAYQRTFVFYNRTGRACEMNRFPGPTDNFSSLDDCHKKMDHYRNLYFLSDDQKCQKVGLNLRLNPTNKLYSTFHECEKFSPTNDRSSNGITPRPVWHTAPAMASFAMRISPETDSRLTKPPYVMIPITIRIISTDTTTTTRLMTTPRRTESKTSPTTTTKRTTTTTTPTTTTTRTIPTTKRPITLEEANNLAYQCCISSGISTKCAATLCRYNAKPDDNRKAYSPSWMGGIACDIRLMKNHLICMTNGKNNLQCCKDRGALPVADCSAFCDPLGYPLDNWPTYVFGAQKFEACGASNTHYLRYQCHLDYSYL